MNRNKINILLLWGLSHQKEMRVLGGVLIAVFALSLALGAPITTLGWASAGSGSA